MPAQIHRGDEERSGTISDGLNTYAATYVGGVGGNDLVLSVTAIPEPSTMVLGGLALLGFAGFRLRREKAKG